ncbi:MAG: SpoIIE family protein phosphatase [Cyclobacteriaceae bacterium]
MSAISLLGSFDSDHRSVKFEVNKSLEGHDAIISACCEKMVAQSIDNMTVEFDNETFLFFLKKDGKIRFIEGKTDDHLSLINKVKLGLEGQLIDKTPNTPTTELKESIPNLTDYAQVQHSMYQSLSHFKKAYSDVRLYFKPYEDPGGDFYWTRDYQYKNLVVLGDCTGHGTLGAMIAMSVMTLLKQFFRLPPTCLKTAIVEFHKQMKGLMEEEILEVFDVELAILLIDKRTSELTYAGSGVNMMHKTNKGTVSQFRSRKSHITMGKAKEDKIPLCKDDQLFIFSDGILDQFDEHNQKRLGSSNLQKFIEKCDHDTPLITFKKHFDQFRGDTKQLDDQSLLILTV